MKFSASGSQFMRRTKTARKQAIDTDLTFFVPAKYYGRDRKSAMERRGGNSFES